MIFRFMKPYLFILILPFVRAVIQYFTKGEVDGLFFPLLAAFVFVLAVAILGWFSMQIIVKDGYITVKKGFLFKSCAVIEMTRLSSIALKQNVLDFVFRSVNCAINTEAGTPKKSDFKIKLHKDDAKELYNLIYGAEEMKIIKFSPFQIALLAATTSSAATGIILGVPFIKKASELVGVAISDMLLDEINNVSLRFKNVFPPIVNSATIILLIAYGVSFAITFLKNVNFQLKSGEKSIEAQAGLIVRKRIAFKKSMVNDICFEQTPLMRVLKRYSMRVSIGGYGDEKGEKAVVVPVARRDELEQHLKTYFPTLTAHGEKISPPKSLKTLKRFAYIPVLLGAGTITIGIVLILLLPYFDRLILFLTAVLLVIDLYYASICWHNYKFGALCLEENIFASGSTGFTVREMYCNKNKTGLIKLSQTPADRRHKTCKLKLTVRSEGADSVKVKNLDLKIAVAKLNEAFKINIGV